MNRAIYLCQPGREKEIYASEIIEKKLFNMDNFICPGCGEDVFFRQGKKQESHFSHYSQNETTRECDYRISGESDLTVYERLGIPLYLGKSERLGYQLFMGLKAVDKKTLEMAEENEAYFELRYSTEETMRKRIDFINFIPDQLNLFEINSYPRHEQAFKIYYSNLPSSIDKWADFIDPVIKEGILFSIGTNVGKSIRHGDVIYADQEYLWLSPKQLEERDILKRNMRLDGELIINNQNHYVYKGQFVKTQQDNDDLEKISDQLRQRLKVQLLDSKNEILPVWPPAIKSKEGYIVTSKGRTYNVIHSLDKEPKIYLYTNGNYGRAESPEVLHQNNRIYLNYQLRDTEVKLDINRQLTSTGIDIKHGHPKYIGKNIVIREETNDVLPLYRKNNSHDLELSYQANVKVTSLIIDSNKRIKARKHSHGKINWRKLNYEDVIFLFNNHNIITQIKLLPLEYELDFSLEEIYLISKMPGKQVALSPAIRQVIYTLIQQDFRYIDCFRIVLNTNKISLRLLKLLQELDADDRRI